MSDDGHERVIRVDVDDEVVDPRLHAGLTDGDLCHLTGRRPCAATSQSLGEDPTVQFGLDDAGREVRFRGPVGVTGAGQQ